MKLLQTLVEAVASKAQMAADEIVSNEMKVASLAKGAADYLKKNFGERLFDTPMAVITQHIRSYIDAATSTCLNRDGLEKVTNAVTGRVKEFLGESVEEAFELTESKMAELDLDFDELSGDDFKKKYGCTKAEMRKKLKESEEESEDEVVKEAEHTANPTATPGQETSVADVFALIMDGFGLDAEDVMMHPRGKAQIQAAKMLQRWYDEEAADRGHHPDDDFEQIMLNVYERMEQAYNQMVGGSSNPFESVNESDDAVLHKAAQEVVAGKRSVEDAAKHYKLTVGELKGEVNLVKDHEYRKKNKLDESEEDSEELEEATRGRPRKNPPKEEKVPAKRGRPAKAKADAKPAAKDDEEEDEKKVSSKALAKSMEDDSDEEDEDTKKADAASKEKPKKIVDTSVKPDELKKANAKLSKQIQHAVDTSSATSAFELSKELRATFKNITTEEVKQACAIWKSEN